MIGVIIEGHDGEWCARVYACFLVSPRVALPCVLGVMGNRVSSRVSSSCYMRLRFFHAYTPSLN